MLCQNSLLSLFDLSRRGEAFLISITSTKRNSLPRISHSGSSYEIKSRPISGQQPMYKLLVVKIKLNFL